MPIPFARPDLGGDELDAVRETLESGWLTTGRRCTDFERRFAAEVGARYAVALNSCTAALHLALDGLGVERGDLVVTTPYTFAATAEVIRYFDAVPVFVDVDPQSFNIDCDALEATLKGLSNGDNAFVPPALRSTTTARKPSALLPVHIAGTPFDVDGLYGLAAQYEIPVVEDAAHAFPARYRGRSIGSKMHQSVRSAICFSFYATKTITTGEGGMLVTDDEHIASRARSMSLHGLSHDAWDRYHTGRPWRYDIVAPGYKYNMSDIAAAIGGAQLSRALAMRRRRAEIASRYDSVFSTCSALQIPVVPDYVESAWHLYMLRIVHDLPFDKRDVLIQELTRRGIGTSVHFIPLHLHSYYQGALGYSVDDFPVSVREFGREISLPIYSSMTDDEIESVSAAVLSALAVVEL